MSQDSTAAPRTSQLSCKENYPQRFFIYLFFLLKIKLIKIQTALMTLLAVTYSDAKEPLVFMCVCVSYLFAARP